MVYGAQERPKTTTWTRHILTVFHCVARNLLTASFWWKYNYYNLPLLSLVSTAVHLRYRGAKDIDTFCLVFLHNIFSSTKFSRQAGKFRTKSKPLDDGDDPGVGEDEGEEGEEIHQTEEGDVVETVHNSRLQQPCKLPTHQGPTVRDPHLYNRG